MNFASIGIEWLIIILVVLNVFSTIILKGTDKYWMSTIFLWVLLLFSFAIVRAVDNSEIEKYELANAQYEAAQDRVEPSSKEAQVNTALELERLKNEATKTSGIFFTLLGVQSIITFFWQLLGVGMTGLKYYRSSAALFFILTLVYLFFQFKALL